MHHTTSHHILNRLHPRSQQVLSCIPNFISHNFPQYQNFDYAVIESGINTLTIRAGNEIFIKVFVPKWMDSSSDLLAMITRNYNLNSKLNLHGICPDCLYFSEYDQMLKAPV
jgi:hypothetical protein